MGDLSGICDDEEKGKSKNWGKHGNLDLYSWALEDVKSDFQPQQTRQGEWGCENDEEEDEDGGEGE